MEEAATTAAAPPSRNPWRRRALALAGWLWPLLLYGWGIRRNPLFLREYAVRWLPGEDVAAWRLRLPAALAVLAAAVLLRLAGLLCRERRAGAVAATVFLLTPVVYACGITANWRPPPWAFAVGTLPWWCFLPTILRGWFSDWGQLRRTPLWLIAVVGAVVTALGTAIFPAWRALTILPFLALFAGGGLCRAAELGVLHGVDRAMRILTGVAAAAALTVFAIHIPARFGSGFLGAARFYGPHEFFFNPVFAGVIAALWFTLAVREKAPRMKFLYLALAVALPLTLLTAALPERFVRDHAPGGFLRSAVLPAVAALPADGVTLVADAPMRPVVRRIFGRAALPLEAETAESLRRRAARRNSGLFIFTSAPESRESVPPSPRRWRSGPFTVAGWCDAPVSAPLPPPVPEPERKR